MNQSNSETRLGSFGEFWPYYVREHSHPVNRVLHFIGSSLGLVWLVAVFLNTSWWYAPLSLVIGYGFAWFGHFFIERNKPATFKYPLWSLRADWKMWGLMLIGRMKPEIIRAAVERT
ncbi:MAG: DUF962 domain-containing protein [Acidobacteria bacterium]|nr:DUF962 domain-containing protein [Acidobacteriota bacterium]